MKHRQGKVVVGGAIAQRPEIGGHTWVFLQYLLGFRRLGWHVSLIDRAPEVDSLPNGQSWWSYFWDAINRFGLEQDFCLLTRDGTHPAGLTRQQAIENASDSDFLLNVMGFIRDEEILSATNKSVFLDIDPGFPQMWKELGQADLFVGHDVFLSVGANIGSADCSIPTCGLDWMSARPPVLLDQWPLQTAHNGRFTTIASWRGPYDPIEYAGRVYGLRVHEFRKFLDIPEMTSERFEVALDIDPADQKDRLALIERGWQLIDPSTVAFDPESYRSYVQASMAEFAVAKDIYVGSQSGWLSDRSVCYLASGKPVLVQDTGLRRRYPTSEGLLTFSDQNEARAGVQEIVNDYERHSHAARELAEEYFDSDVVLEDLIQKVSSAR